MKCWDLTWFNWPETEDIGFEAGKISFLNSGSCFWATKKTGGFNQEPFGINRHGAISCGQYNHKPEVGMVYHQPKTQ